MSQKKNNQVFGRSREYLKYSGLAFQFAGLVIAGYLIGGWLDRLLHFEKPVMTVLLILVMFTGYMYKLYMELSKKP